MCVLASAVDIVILTHREAVISEQLVTASLRFYSAFIQHSGDGAKRSNSI